jgi:cAMP-dependent protein kinase regulator
MAQPLEDDTLEKIHSYVKDMDINGTYVDMTEQLLMFRPENPIRFMIDYLSFKHKDSIEKGCYLRSEEEGKGDEGVKWTWTDKKDMPSSDRGESKMADDLDIASDSEDDDDDYVDELPVVKTRTQRKAVSSGVATDLSGFEPKKVEKSIDEREKIMSILTSNNFFSQVTDEQRAIMADAMTKAEFKDGAEVIKQGDQGDTFYVLDSGVADVWVSKDGAEPAKVFTYEEGSGAAFGELALLYNSPRAATVRANGPVSLWALDQMTFKYTMQQNTTATRDTNVGWLKQVSLLADLSEVESFKIADALRTVKFAKGDSIITQGDKGNNFYILKSGVASCTVNQKATESKEAGSIEVLRVEEGGYFGEIALLTNQPRKANVIALEDCETLVLDRATFKRVMGPLESILERNMENYKDVMRKMGL